MTTEELTTVFERLYEQTTRKVLKWKPTQGGGLRVDFARSSIEISEHTRQGAKISYALKIYNNTGAVIAVIDPTQEGYPEAKLNQLYADAYNSAYEIDATVQDILAGLGSKPDLLRPGFYAARFSAPSTGNFGEGLVIVGEGKLNGGDQGFLYRGSYYLTGPASLSGTLNVKRWNANVSSIFGNLSQFDLNLVGQVTAATAISIDGAVTQQPGMKIRIEARWIESAV